jgi:hypothetical protein
MYYIFTFLAWLLMNLISTNISAHSYDSHWYNLVIAQGDNVEVKVLKNGSGQWGYQIYRQSQLLISQFQIPAVPGIQYFKDSMDAQKVGELVKQKIFQQNSFPSISIDELKKLNIKI